MEEGNGHGVLKWAGCHGLCRPCCLVVESLAMSTSVEPYLNTYYFSKIFPCQLRPTQGSRPNKMTCNSQKVLVALYVLLLLILNSSCHFSKSLLLAYVCNNTWLLLKSNTKAFIWCYYFWKQSDNFIKYGGKWFDQTKHTCLQGEEGEPMIAGWIPQSGCFCRNLVASVKK